MQSSADVADLGVADIARILWRRKVSIILLVALAAAAAIGLDSRRTSIYEASTQLLLTRPLSQLAASTSGAPLPLSVADVSTAANIIASSSTERSAAHLLKRRTVPPASVSTVGTTNVVQVSVRSANPVLAARAATAYANAYITQQRTQAVSSLEKAAAQISTKIAALTRQLNSVQARIAAVPPGTPTSASTLASLRAKASGLVAQQGTLGQQVTQLQSSADLASGGGQIVNVATIPTGPVLPHKYRDAALAALAGLLIGVAIAILREFLDDRIRSEEELDLARGSIPALGMVPVVPEWSPKRRTSDDTPIITKTAPMSPAAEAYRSLRTSIQFLRLDQDVRSIVVTSPASGEGKTTTVANLADAMARLGQRVVLLSCDLRKPQLHSAFDLPGHVGFTSVLLGEVTVAEALQKVPGYDDLWFMAAGPIPPNPAELLASRRCEGLLRDLAANADVVLIDTPPTLPVTDAVVLASRADACLLVVAAGRTTRSQTRRAIEVLSRVDAAPMGVIVNRMSHGRRTGYGYGYGYEHDRSQGRRWGRSAKGDQRDSDDAVPSSPNGFDDSRLKVKVGAAERRSAVPTSTVFADDELSATDEVGGGRTARTTTARKPAKKTAARKPPAKRTTARPVDS